MKFISFIASTMLIVLIGQHSIMGAPAPQKNSGGSCLRGYEMVYGQCKPINSMTNSTGTRTLLYRPVTQFTPIRSGSCAKGMKHGKYGICEPIQSATVTEVNSRESTDPNSEEIVTMIMNAPKLVTYPAIRDGACPEGMKHGKYGICESIQSETDTEVNSQERADPNTEEAVTMIMDEPKLVTDKPIRDGACPEGMKHGKYGICEPMETSSTTEATDELTTELNANAVGGFDIPKGCPNGTQPDEQGYCQTIQPANSTKFSTDPRNLLQQDGSCPENYKKSGSQCLYIKPETNSTLYSGDSIGDGMTGNMQPNNDNNRVSDIELVPVLPDNSCPAGTVYSSYGLCQKRARPSSSNLLMNPDGSCPDNLELVDSKCIPKDSKITDQSGFPTTTINMFKPTPFPQATSNNDKSSEETNTVGQ